MVKQRWLVAALIGLVLLFSQCVAVPVRAKKESRAPSGLGEKLYFSFIAPGVSMAEVEQRLSSINTHADTPGLFWGRFITSRQRMVGAIYERNWDGENLLVSYDAAGIVSSSQTVPEDKLDAILATWIATHPRSVRSPMRFIARWWFSERSRHRDSPHGELVLDKDAVTFTPFKLQPIVKTQRPSDLAEYAQRLKSMDKPLAGSPGFVAAPRQILSVFPSSPPPQSLGAVRYVRIIATNGKKQGVEIYLTPDQLLDLLQYAHDQNPSVAYANY